MNEKVLLIDDHALFRAGLEDLLNRRGIKVVAAVDSGEYGIQLVEELAPDIVLLDVRMPQMGGLKVLQKLLNNHKDLKVAILTTSTDEHDLLEALRTGARGYLLKDIDPDELIVAIQKMLSGRIIVAPELSSVLAHFIRGENGNCLNDDEAASPFAILTPRQYETLTLLAEGQSNKLIARNLGISAGTVKLHVKEILRKLGVSSRVEAAIMLVEYDTCLSRQEDSQSSV